MPAQETSTSKKKREMAVLSKIARCMRKYVLALIAFFMFFSCKKLEVVQDSVSEVAELFASMEQIDRTKTVQESLW